MLILHTHHGLSSPIPVLVTPDELAYEGLLLDLVSRKGEKIYKTIGCNCIL